MSVRTDAQKNQAFRSSPGHEGKFFRSEVGLGEKAIFQGGHQIGKDFECLDGGCFLKAPVSRKRREGIICQKLSVKTYRSTGIGMSL